MSAKEMRGRIYHNGTTDTTEESREGGRNRG